MNVGHIPPVLAMLFVLLFAHSQARILHLLSAQRRLPVGYDGQGCPDQGHPSRRTGRTWRYHVLLCDLCCTTQADFAYMLVGPVPFLTALHLFGNHNIEQGENDDVCVWCRQTTIRSYFHIARCLHRPPW